MVSLHRNETLTKAGSQSQQLLFQSAILVSQSALYFGFYGSSFVSKSQPRKT